MEAPTSYLDLLEGQAGIKERIERIKKENIAAEMRVYLPRSTPPRRDAEAELSLYSKDLLTNKIKETMLYFDKMGDSIKTLRDRMQRGEWDDEFKLGSERSIYVNTYSDDRVVIMSNRLSTGVDKALFLRLLEEYVEIIESREGRVGILTVTVGGEVIKRIMV